MPLDIVIFKQGKEKEYVSIDIFSRCYKTR